MNPVLIFLVIAAVIAAGMIMRGGSKDETIESPGEDAPDPEADTGSVLDVDEPEGGMVEAAAITSDGYAFVPRGAGVELVPPGEDDAMLEEQAERHGSSALKQAMSTAPINPHTGKRLVFWKPGEALAPGDLIAARVVRGAPDYDPWRLETLGRDYDYRPFAFQSEDSARTAMELVEERIVRPPRDRDGDPIPVGDEDFVVARRQFEETADELGVDEPPEEER